MMKILEISHLMLILIASGAVVVFYFESITLHATQTWYVGFKVFEATKPWDNLHWTFGLSYISYVIQYLPTNIWYNTRSTVKL